MEEDLLNNDFLNCETCELIAGTNMDIHVNRNECEVRTDIIVEKKRSVRIWGQVLTTDHCAVENALVELVRVSKNCECGKRVYEGIAHTITDSQGFYQFEVCSTRDEFFKVVVGKAVPCVRAIPLLEESLAKGFFKD
jgi:hypothetical protein